MKNARTLNLIGRTFGRLVVVEHRGSDKRHNALWYCVCSCGGTTVTRTFMLTSGRTKSCSCLQKSVARDKAKIRVVVDGKTCSTCRTYKKAALFPFKQQSKDSLGSNCNYCKNVVYKRKNKAKTIERTTRRKKHIKQATPTWVTKEQLLHYYETADRLTKETGVKHHVDHIIPLRGVLVSGLHTPANLQVLPWLDNLIKSNHYA